MQGSRNLLTAHVFVLICAALLQACTRGGQPLQATLLPEPMVLPEVSLVDDDGSPFTRDSMLGQWTVLFFGFTPCPDICPTTLQQLATARSRLAVEKPASPLPEIVLISVDPERDTPAVLGEYVAYFGENLHGASGDPRELALLTSSIGIFFEKEPVIDGDYNVSHSTAVVLINPSAEFHAVIGSPLDIDAIVHDLPLLMADK